MNTVPELHTLRCVLKEITQADIPVLRQIVDDELFQSFLPELYSLVKTPEGLQQFLYSFDNYLTKNEGVLWGIRKDETLIGFVAIMDLSYDPTIFYAIHREYRNKGYAKEVVSEIVAYYRTFSNAPLHTEMCQFNRASLAVLASCGFQITESKDNKFLLTL